MDTKKHIGIPSQVKGACHDTESQKEFVVPELAFQKYAELKKRFLNINHWKDYCGESSTDFKLYNSLGEPVSRNPEIGDFVRINIPGPGDLRTNGFDWVQITEITDHHVEQDEIESMLMLCKPSKIPGNNNENIAHFYSSEATSSFRIARGIDFIRIGIYWRNEVANFSNVGFLGRIRNFIITLGGFVKVSKIQWKCLAEGLLDF